MFGAGPAVARRKTVRSTQAMVNSYQDWSVASLCSGEEIKLPLGSVRLGSGYKLEKLRTHRIPAIVTGFPLASVKLPARWSRVAHW